MAKLADVSYGTIRNFESSTHCPHYTTVIRIAEALDVGVSDIDTPAGNTNLGKPAQSSGRSGSKNQYGKLCQKCNIEMPLYGTCDCA